MTDELTLPPNFQPAPLDQQLEAILREAHLARQRLPNLAKPGSRGRPPKMHWGTVNQRINEYRSLALTFLVLKKLSDEGRLPPELARLQEGGQAMPRTSPRD